jgi:hypothetical protein
MKSLNKSKERQLKLFLCFWIIILILKILNPLLVFASEKDPYGSGLNFVTPLVTEPAKLETEIRFNSENRLDGDEGDIYITELELEYALSDRWGIEAVPKYIIKSRGNNRDGWGDLEVETKYVFYRSEEKRFLASCGLEVELPTGSTHKGLGSGHVSMAPFIYGAWGFSRFSLQGNIIPEFTLGEPDKELKYNLAFTSSFREVIHPMFEINGETVLAGSGKGEDIINGTPGILFGPFETKTFKDILFGIGIQIPITEREEFDENILFTLRMEF